MAGITFFLEPSGHPPSAGAIRPFVIWARELSGSGVRAELVLLRADEEFCGSLDASKVPFRNFSDIQSAASHIASAEPQIVISDDSPEHLRHTAELKRRTGVRTGTYVQILFGTHALCSCYELKNAPIMAKAQNAIMKMIPFAAYRNVYRMMAGRKGETLICNSQFSSSMLQMLYGLEPDGIAYPPVDGGVFCPKEPVKKNQALVYLGSYGWDTDRAFAEKACGALSDSGVEVVAFGNPEVARNLRNRMGIRCAGRLDDAALAGLYSESILTVCLQKWETFGYVAAESISCGTPVLAHDCMGYSEIARNTGMGLLASNRGEMLGILGDVESALRQARMAGKPPYKFDSKRSAADLLGALKLSGMG